MRGQPSSLVSVAPEGGAGKFRVAGRAAGNGKFVTRLVAGAAAMAKDVAMARHGSVIPASCGAKSQAARGAVREIKKFPIAVCHWSNPTRMISTMFAASATVR